MKYITRTLLCIMHAVVVLTQCTWKRDLIIFLLHSLLSGEEDLLDVTDYLQNIDKIHIYNLGLVLGLRHNKVKTMMDSATFLDDVIAAWLRKEDKVPEKGEPSWIVLVNALKHRRVGQTGIANDIAKDIGLVL